MRIVQTWKESVLHGNACFDQGRWYDAEAYYTSAIDQLEYLWLLDRENCQLMMGWVRSIDPNQRCRTLLASNPPLSSEGLWMVEEFAVSLFAQELGTSIPVSPKRLAKQWQRVAR